MATRTGRSRKYSSSAAEGGILAALGSFDNNNNNANAPLSSSTANAARKPVKVKSQQQQQQQQNQKPRRSSTAGSMVKRKAALGLQEQTPPTSVIFSTNADQDNDEDEQEESNMSMSALSCVMSPLASPLLLRRNMYPRFDESEGDDNDDESEDDDDVSGDDDDQDDQVSAQGSDEISMSSEDDDDDDDSQDEEVDDFLNAVHAHNKNLSNDFSESEDESEEEEEELSTASSNAEDEEEEEEVLDDEEYDPDHDEEATLTDDEDLEEGALDEDDEEIKKRTKKTPPTTKDSSKALQEEVEEIDTDTSMDNDEVVVIESPGMVRVAMKNVADSPDAVDNEEQASSLLDESYESCDVVAEVVTGDEDDDDDDDVLVATINEVFCSNDTDTPSASDTDSVQALSDVENEEESFGGMDNDDGIAPFSPEDKADENEACLVVETKASKEVESPKQTKDSKQTDDSSYTAVPCEKKNIAVSKPATTVERIHSTPSPRHQRGRPRQRRTRREGNIQRGKWTLGAKIGSGAFGVVHIGMNTATGALMAVKSVKMSQAVMKDVRREVDLLKSLEHVNIVRYHGAEMDKSHLHIFQEWVPGGSVTGMLAKFGPFSLDVLRSYLSQILEGLAYLHENDIMHRDIKGSNILVSDEGIVKLADFGASKRLENAQKDMMMSLTMRGTPYFMAVEVFEEKYSMKADVWSVGCVAIQMATGTPPWKSLGYSNPVALFSYLKSHQDPPQWEVASKDNMNPLEFGLLKSLVAKCFKRDPMERPSAKSLQHDPFFSEVHTLSDDDHSTSRGLFSPDSHCSWGDAMNSPMAAKQLSPTPSRFSRSNSVGPRRSPFMSPPLPKRTGTGPRASPSPAPFSPQPDTNEWPTWAREKHESNTVAVAPTAQDLAKLGKVDALAGKVIDLMGSLALSDDSSVASPARGGGNRGSIFRRLPSEAPSTVRSPLEGLHFLGHNSLSASMDA